MKVEDRCDRCERCGVVTNSTMTLAVCAPDTVNPVLIPISGDFEKDLCVRCEAVVRIALIDAWNKCVREVLT